MKKNIISIILLGLMILIPTNASATSASLSINCSSVYVGETTTCKVSGYSSGSISSIQGNISASGNISIVSVTNSGWDMPMSVTTSEFSLLSNTDKTGTFSVVNIVIKGNSAGYGNLTISDVKGSDNNYETISGSGASKQISVVNKTTAPTTQKPTTVVTTQATQTQIKTKATTAQVQTTLVVETTQVVYNLALTSLKVDNFEVKYENDKYYVTTNYDTESVNIEATAEEGIQIIGSGTRQLAVGKNVVDIVLVDPQQNRKTVEIIITRPEDTNTYNTALSKLKVVGYDFDFDSAKTEYTVYVPYNTNDIYVIAESVNKDVDINGAGLVTLKKGTNEIIVKVTYGDKSSTTYTIKIKRSYTMLILIIALSIVSIGFIGFIIYTLVIAKNKKTVVATIGEEKKSFATPHEAKETIKVGVTNGVGVGSSLSEPRAEVMAFDSGKEMTENDKNILDRTIKSTLVQPTIIKKEENVPIKVQTVKVPTTNVQGYVVPKQANNISTPPQVRVVKTVTNVPTQNVQSTQQTETTNQI